MNLHPSDAEGWKELYFKSLADSQILEDQVEMLNSQWVDLTIDNDILHDEVEGLKGEISVLEEMLQNALKVK